MAQGVGGDLEVTRGMSLYGLVSRDSQPGLMRFEGVWVQLLLMTEVEGYEDLFVGMSAAGDILILNMIVDFIEVVTSFGSHPAGRH